MKVRQNPPGNSIVPLNGAVWVGFLLLAVTTPTFAHSGHSVSMELAQHFGNEGRDPSPATNEVTISVEGDYRKIVANGIPNHVAGAFPNRGNPNTISPQRYNFRVPIKPQIAAQPTVLRMQPFGIAVNGVVFDPFAAEWWQRDRESGWQYEPMNMKGRLGADENNAHVQPNGAYHYHSIPVGLVEKLSGGKSQMTLVGWAADGFPMYAPLGYTKANDSKSALKTLKSSYRVKKGVRPNGPGGNYDGAFVADYEFVKGAGDLDECNGRFGVTPEFTKGTYYYVLTDDFPFIPRFFKGTPDPSFSRRGMPPRGGGPRPEREPRDPLLPPSRALLDDPSGRKTNNNKT